MIGTTLSHYEITAELGRGGMGIVYQAEDTKLDRTVAIKILPSAALASSDDRERFYREAKSAAQLHHPNIASVFEIDEAVPEGGDAAEPRPFIAMEYIAGGTLQDKIKEKPLSLPDAVKIASQVAEALKAAHAKDIVHRDIKSANVMITEDGVAKVLDFGLAKTNQSTMLTRMGSTLGTVAYMSPEQARGQEVDGRTDLYSLGTMLYEMVAGRLPFAGEYEQAVVYSILNEPPEPLTSLRTGVPMDLERIVNKLLAKDADYRYQTATDLLVDLKSVDLDGSGYSRRSMPAMSATAIPVAAKSGSQKPAWMLPVVAAIMLLCGLGGGWALFGSSGPDLPLRQVEVSFDGLRNLSFPVLSPGGRYLAVQAMDIDGRNGIFVKDLETNRVRYLEGTDVAGWEMRFSPDGSRLAFMKVFNEGVYTIELPDGLPERLTDHGRIAYWQDNETVVMTDDRPGGGPSYRVPIDGSNLEEIRLDETDLKEGMSNVLKTGIPGTSRAFGFQTNRINTAGNTDGTYYLFTADLDTGELVMLDSSAANPEYIDGGYLIYNLDDDDGELQVRPVDPKSGLFVGQPKPALSGNLQAPWGNFGVSNDGDLIYSKDPYAVLAGVAGAVQSGTWGIWAVNIQSRQVQNLETRLPVDSRPTDILVSSDGGTVYFTESTPRQKGDIYALDLQAGIQTQITFGGRNFASSLSADGQWLYAHRRAGQDDASSFTSVRIRLDGSGTEEVIQEGTVLPRVSPDGTHVLLTEVDQTWTGVSIVSLEGSQSTTLTEEGTYGMGFGFSPDGRYVIVVNEDAELVVISVDGRQRYVLPDIAGQDAEWSADGSYIYYTSSTANLVGRVPVRMSPTFSVLGPAEEVHRVDGAVDTFSLDADGNLYVASNAPISQSNPVDLKTVVWMQNWSAYLDDLFGR